MEIRNHQKVHFGVKITNSLTWGLIVISTNSYVVTCTAMPLLFKASSVSWKGTAGGAVECTDFSMRSCQTSIVFLRQWRVFPWKRSFWQWSNLCHLEYRDKRRYVFESYHRPGSSDHSELLPVWMTPVEHIKENKHHHRVKRTTLRSGMNYVRWATHLKRCLLCPCIRIFFLTRWTRCPTDWQCIIISIEKGLCIVHIVASSSCISVYLIL